MATPHDLGRPRFESTCHFPSLVIAFLVVMETVRAFNYSEALVTCEDLACGHHTVCNTSVENGTQVGHAYCRCHGEWAGPRCQSKLHVYPSSISSESVTLHIRGIMTSSSLPKPRESVPATDLHMTDFTVSFWNLNGSEGCSILRLSKTPPSVTVRALDRNQSYVLCAANGPVDMCKLRSLNSSELSSRSNCVVITTLYKDKEKIDIGLILVPIYVVFIIVIIISVLCLKRKSLFVQFLLNVCCCRKCYCYRKRMIRKKRHLMSKHRNVSGSVLLPPDLPFDDSMSFAPSFASNSLSSTAVGNRSSLISDSFRSGGFTPESDETFPTFLEENPNPLYNPNVIGNADFRPSMEFPLGSELTLHNFQPVTTTDVGFHPIENDDVTKGQGLNSLHNTFRGSSNFTSSYFTDPNDVIHKNTPEVLEKHKSVNGEEREQIQTIRHNPIPRNYFSNEFYNTESPSLPSTPFTIQNPHQFIPNGTIHRQHSCPAEGKSPPGAVRVFPHGNEWTSFIHRQSSGESNRPRTLDRRGSGNRRRHIFRQRPLSYNLDYRYPINMDYYTEDMKELLGLKPSTSQEEFKVSTLPRSSRKRCVNESPRRMSGLYCNNNNNTSSSQSFYSINTLPHMNNTQPHPLETTASSTTLTPDTVPNGTVRHSRDDIQSLHSHAGSSISKDSRISEPPFIKKRVKSLIGQFERSLPFLRHHNNRNSDSFCDDEYFKDLASPLAVERRQNPKRKNRPISHPHLNLFDPQNTSSVGSKLQILGVHLDPIFQGHPSLHVLPPFTTEEEPGDDVFVGNDKTCAVAKEGGVLQASKTTSSVVHNKDKYVISAFDDDSTNLVTPFIVKKSSSDSDESVDKIKVTTTLTSDFG